MKSFLSSLLLVLMACGIHDHNSNQSHPIYQYDEHSATRWFSFENPTGQPGAGAKENNGAKGHPCDDIPAHTSVDLMNYKGTGIIRRIWLTINDRSAYMLRGLVINMYWDGAEKPAVSAPIGDFFGQGFERRLAFENELFSSGEGRSFVSFISMPFKVGARIEIINDTDKDLDMIFYDIDMQAMDGIQTIYIFMATGIEIQQPSWLMTLRYCQRSGVEADIWAPISASSTIRSTKMPGGEKVRSKCTWMGISVTLL